MIEKKKRMEELREQLNRLVDDIDSCDMDKLLNISQEMDKIIYEYIIEEKKQSSGVSGLIQGKDRQI